MKILGGDNIQLGVCYYPEHWDKSLWAEDLDRMLSAGLKTVRIAEFAWNKIEIREGVYDDSFFDEFLELCVQKGMQVIFCTPTATPPAWMQEKYPEILNADIDGHLIHHGLRRNYNYNSPIYRDFTVKIVEHLGEHYGKHPAIVGWQLDNEFNCENDKFYSESDHIAFRKWVQDKYETLDAVNDAWGTVFWNQTYMAWDEIYLPRRTNGMHQNPHQLLDYKRFIEDSTRSYAKLQSDILRKYIGEDVFITTNGMFNHIDNPRLTKECLDFYTYDSYPDFGYLLDDYKEGEGLHDRWWSRHLTEVRAISEHFGIMEQQSGACGWTGRMEAPTPRPGQIALWTTQSIAHGADYVSYFRWRTCTFGTEIYWHGILDYSGRDNRRLYEVMTVNSIVNKISETAGSTYKAKVAILVDYDNTWDEQYDNWHKRVQEVSHNALVNRMQLTHTPFDFVYIREWNLTEVAEKLSRYEVVFYPHASILTAERMRVLENYVANGGKLVMAARTGYKDLNGKCVMDKLPGLARELTGTDIPEYSFVAPDEAPSMANWNGRQIEAAVFNDVLAPLTKESKILAKYSTTYIKGEPALIEHPFGKGKAYYFGGALSESAVDAFLEYFGVNETFADKIELPECCEIAVKEKNGNTYYFVLNYSPKPVMIHVRGKMTDLIGGMRVIGDTILNGYGVAVYKEDK